MTSATFVVDIPTGDRHSLILDRDGIVYSFDDDNRSQLGVCHIGSEDCVRYGDDYRDHVIRGPSYTPTQIKGISAGGEHSLILDENGVVWSFGADNRS